MQITLLCVGKLKETFYRDACAEYEKRLSRYHKLTILEVADAPVKDDSPASIARALEKEAERLIPHMKKGYAVALALDGAMPDTPGLLQKMEGYARLGQPLLFIIGGSHGLDQRVLAMAKERLSLSPLTFPHNLARLVLLEQLYRTAKMDAGETYHK
ncbi:23S rRNA (pseudouridine(1915)-N(3))-methyltransferase RlmH [Eubacteriales bacterium OttesenSCG-928-M02]|nr:23S rRNA (pseudouridine(1915)-N(3))-methyltransferase RlmH [Eubacteriales bacterium OttesenSCG-928-M02]